jgi:hypothetical protein
MKSRLVWSSSASRIERPLRADTLCGHYSE